MTVRAFVRESFRHFNAGELHRAADAYLDHIAGGGKMILALGGALSTAEIGVLLAEMIRGGFVHGICCTAANVEEDFFSLLARPTYVAVPNYRELTPEDETALCSRGLNRITDTCLPEAVLAEAIGLVSARWRQADAASESLPFHKLFCDLLATRDRPAMRGNLRESWLLAAAETELPLFVPGWEDSSIGNAFAADLARQRVTKAATIAPGVEYMVSLATWYAQASCNPVGLLQLGGGISGDFAVSVVPLLRTELEQHRVPPWSYYCQVGDSTTSYGSYSGAPPEEKITWGKLSTATRRFSIQSDATIVAPLLFAYVMNI